MNVGLVPKSCKYAEKGGLEDQDPKIKYGFDPKIIQIPGDISMNINDINQNKGIKSI